MEFEFPDTGEGVTEGKFLEWKINEGDKVEEDQILGEAETDKAVVEIPSPSDGTVEKLEASPGDTVSVGDVIMELNTEEKTEEIKQDNKESEASESTGNSENVETVDDESVDKRDEESSGNVLALPKVRKMAEKNNIDLSDIKTGERITEEELEAWMNDSEVSGDKKTQESAQSEKEMSKEDSSVEDVSARPSVRKLAREKGIDISNIDGTGRGGEVTRSDVENFSEEDNETSRDVSQNEVSADEDGIIGRSLSGLEKSVGEKMSKSKFTAPHVTHVEKADVTELSQLRDDLKDDVDPHLTFMPFIMKAVVPALKEYPELNSELDEENDELLMKDFYCFNIAVDTERGLLVPKIKNVDGKSIVELAGELESTVDKARNGELNAEDMSTGSFSITNIGSIGGEAFTPIINYPQTAILGIGKISESAEVVDGEVVPRTTVKLSLSYDHRVVDGATAARFMNEVVENLENPNKMLLNL